MKTLPTIAQTEVAYDTAQAKQNELRSSRDAVETTLAGAATLRTDTGQQAIALLDGPGDEDEPTVDREALEREAEILDRAIQVNEQRVLEAARAHGAAMYTARQDEHRELVEAVLSAFESLADAIQSERAFRDSFSRWSTSVAPAIKTTEAPWLRFFLQRGIRDTLRRANAERFRLEKPTPTTKGK